MPEEPKRPSTILIILLFIQILILISIFLLIKQVDKAVVEIKKFCWGDKVGDVLGNGLPNIRTIN